MDLTSQKVKSKINYKKALVFIVTRKLRDKSYKGRIKKFTGYANIGRFKINEMQNLHINFEILEGQAALVAIQNDDIKIITQENFNSYVTLPFKKGYMRLRLIGDQAHVQFLIKKI